MKHHRHKHQRAIWSFLALHYKISGLWISCRELVNTESCQEIKFKQYGQSWFCLFRALSIFAGRMISNRLAKRRMDYYHVEFIWQGRVKGFINSNTHLSGCCFASHTRCQTHKLHPSLILFLAHAHADAFLLQLPFFFKQRKKIYAKVQNRVNWIKNLD